MKQIVGFCSLLFFLGACSDPEHLLKDAGSDGANIQSDLGNDLSNQGSDAATIEDADIIIDPNEKFIGRELVSQITEVQPMTGIVLWEDSWNEGNVKRDTQIEYAYFPPNWIVTGKGQYDWTVFDDFLDRVESRGHQAMPRFYYTYIGQETAVPDYVKMQESYSESSGQSEGQQTFFPDWRNEELKEATIDFFTAFAQRYDNDPRIAFLQVGFGLWGEYHIYDGPNESGKDFPSYAFQRRFMEHLDEHLKTLRWSISVDAASSPLSAFPDQAELKNAKFGLFDDSSMHERHAEENESNWDFFQYVQRQLYAPHGGEFSYYTNFDQRNALNPDGLHGHTFESFSKRFYISYMIGNDQPGFEFSGRIKEAGLATGYKFRIKKFESSQNNSRVGIENFGVAPIYYDAYPTVGGLRSTNSLKGLGPGETKEFVIPKGEGELTISSDRLVEGQAIQFEAALSAE